MRLVIAVLTLIAVGATALLVARAAARPAPGTYVGRTAQGRTITIEVRANTIRSVETHVRCGGESSSVQIVGRAPLRGERFAFAVNEAIHVDGRFDGTTLRGSIDYGRSSRCPVRAHFRAALVRRR